MGFFDMIFKRDKLAKEISNLETRRNALYKDIADAQRKSNDLGAYIDFQMKQTKELEQVTNIGKGIVEMQDMGLEYTPLDTNNEEITKKITDIENSIAKLYTNAEICQIQRTYTLNNSTSKGLKKKAMNIAFDKAFTDEERAEIKEKIAGIDRRIEDADYRVANTKAGWLYVISSPSLPNMVKVGCSRRESPWTRVRELSSSSLPIPFKAHCFVFSDDCFELEFNMHKYFDAQRVNKDREFFAITPQNAIDALKNEFHANIWYVDDDYKPEDED